MSAATTVTSGDTARIALAAQSATAKATMAVRVPRLVWLDGEPFEIDGDWEVCGIHLLASQTKSGHSAAQSQQSACLA